MNVLYCRVSTLDQKTDRQKVNESDYSMVVEDRCSGAIPFFERQGGKEILKLLQKRIVNSVAVWSIDRLGRDLRDIINTIHFFNENKIPINFISQGLVTLDNNGNENSISKMIISILGIVGEMERNQLKERQREGIALAKNRGIYKGRAKGTKEDVLKFLSKEKNKKALEMLNKGYKAVEISKLLELNVNTITKVKKLGFRTVKN